MAKKNLYINDVSLGTYGIYISSDTVLNSPKIDYDVYSIPGRSGDVIQYKKRLNNIIRKFTCYIPEGVNTFTAMVSLKRLLYQNPGYMKIASDYEGGSYYQYGYLAEELDAEPFDNYKTATFDLYFSCSPQKYFNTSGSTTIPCVYINARRHNIWGVLKRTDPFMQTIFDSIEPNLIPDDEMFYVLGGAGHGVGIHNGDIISNLNASWSGGSTFVAIVIGEHNMKPSQRSVDVQLCSNQSISNGTFTAAVSEIMAMYMIVPARTTGSYTFTYTSSYSGNNYDEGTGDLSTDTVTITEPAAFGAKVTFDATFRYYDGISPNTYLNKSILVNAFTNNIKTGETLISIVSDNEIPQSLCDLMNTYAVIEWHSYKYTVSVDYENRKTYLKKTGLPDLPIDNVMQITGSLNELFDRLDCTTVRMDTDEGDKATINHDWWGV